MFRLFYPRGKEPSVRNGQEGGWSALPVWTFRTGKIFLCYWESNLYPLVALTKWWRRWVGTSQYFIMWCRVVWWKITYISKKGTASIISVFFRTVGKCLAGYTASHPRKLWHLSYVVTIYGWNCPCKALTGWFLGAFAKLRKTIPSSSCLSVCLFVRPSARYNSAPTGRIFSKFATCRANSSFGKIWQEQRVFYMNTSIHFWSYLSQFFLEWEMFQTKVVEKIKTQIVRQIYFFPPENRVLYEMIKI